VEEDESEGQGHNMDGGDEEEVIGDTPVTSVLMSKRSGVKDTIPEGYESTQVHLEAFKTLTAACAIAEMESAKLESGGGKGGPTSGVEKKALGSSRLLGASTFMDAMMRKGGGKGSMTRQPLKVVTIPYRIRRFEPLLCEHALSPGAEHTTVSDRQPLSMPLFQSHSAHFDQSVCSAKHAVDLMRARCVATRISSAFDVDSLTRTDPMLRLFHSRFSRIL